MGRAIGGVLVGLVAAFATVFVVELDSSFAFPSPPGMDPRDMESVRQHMSQVSTGAFLMLLVAYGLATFVGSVVARRVAGDRVRWAPLTVAGLFFAVCAWNFYSVPGPTWMIMATVVLVPAAAWMAMRPRPAT